MLHITLQCLHLVLNTNVYKMIETSQGVLHVFLYKHNAYKHIQPGISEQNKHMLNIVSNFENSYSFFFCFKYHSEAYSEPCQTSKIKLLPKIVNVF